MANDYDPAWINQLGRGGEGSAWPSPAAPPSASEMVLKPHMNPPRHVADASRPRSTPPSHTEKQAATSAAAVGVMVMGGGEHRSPLLSSSSRVGGSPGEPSASSSSIMGLPYTIPTSSAPASQSRSTIGAAATLSGHGQQQRTPRSPSKPNGNSNFNVVIRVRPPLPRELQPLYPGGGSTYLNVCHISPDDPCSITLCDAVETADGRSAVYARQTFTFDRVFGEDTDQETLYQGCAHPAVLSVLKGYNGTLMAYGQTGTGKTYTMEGFTNEKERGIIPRAVEDIFYFIDATRRAEREEGEVEVEVGGGPAGGPRRRARKRSETTFLIRASYMQIYNEVLSDLLAADSPPNTHAQRPSAGAFSPPPSASMYKPRPLVIRHTPQDGVYVEGLSQWRVETEDDVYALIERGTALRATSATRMSELSSRSHAIFTLVVEATTTTTTTVDGGIPTSSAAHRVGKLNIVDLAGSEKVRHTGVSGQRLEETKKINKSLHELGNVISALARQQQLNASHNININNNNNNSASGRRGGGSTSLSTPRGGASGVVGAAPIATHHIPFRNSALTSVLRDSLGGNCITTLIACLSPSLDAYAESLSTLSFANRAKNITNHAVANIGFSQAMTMVNTGAGRPGFGDPTLDASQLANGEMWSKNAALALQQAADDAEQAVLVMDRRRRKAEEEKDALHRALQQRTKEREQEREKREALQAQLALLRQQAGHVPLHTGDGNNNHTNTNTEEEDGGLRASDRYQVERYKQLLLKQRDIMLSLTTRLNERDEIILHLEDELDRYGQRIEELEAAAVVPVAGSASTPRGGDTSSMPLTRRTETTETAETGSAAAGPSVLSPEWKELLDRRSAALAAERTAAAVFPLQKRVNALLLERQHLRLRCEGLLSALLHQSAAVANGPPRGGQGSTAEEDGDALDESVGRSSEGGDGAFSSESSPATTSSPSKHRRQRTSPSRKGRGSAGGGLSGSALLRETVEQLEELLQSNLKSFEEALEREHQERWRLSRRTEQLQRRVELALPSSASAGGTPTSQTPIPKSSGFVLAASPSLSGSELGELAKELEQAEMEILTAVRHHEETMFEEELARREAAVAASATTAAERNDANNSGGYVDDQLVEAQRQWQEVFQQQYTQIKQLQAALEAAMTGPSGGGGGAAFPSPPPCAPPSSAVAAAGDAASASPAVLSREDLAKATAASTEPLTRKLEAYERDRQALAVILERKLLRRVEAALHCSESEKATAKGDTTMDTIHRELEGLRHVLCSTISALQEEEGEEAEDEETDDDDDDDDEDHEEEYVK